MPDKPPTFEGLLGRAPSVPSNLDKEGRPYVRRTTDGHVMAITDPLKPFPPLSWIVVYAGCPAGCDGRPGIGSHRTDLTHGDRLGDEHVGAWPFLNPWGARSDWVLEEIAALQKGIKTHKRTYGHQSAQIGALRAELARARERIRELEAALDTQAAADADEYVADGARLDLAMVEEEHRRATQYALRVAGATGRAQWAPEGCVCPWPWPLNGAHVVGDCPHYTPDPAPAHQGRTGCRFEYGSWIHYPSPDHTCPDYVRDIGIGGTGRRR